MARRCLFLWRGFSEPKSLCLVELVRGLVSTSITVVWFLYPWSRLGVSLALALSRGGWVVVLSFGFVRRGFSCGYLT